MNDRAMMWFDGSLFQSGTEKEFNEASRKVEVREINGFGNLNLPQAKQVVDNLNRSNIIQELWNNH